jgi:hypothetical protein
MKNTWYKSIQEVCRFHVLFLSQKLKFYDCLESYDPPRGLARTRKVDVGAVVARNDATV